MARLRRTRREARSGPGSCRDGAGETRGGGEPVLLGGGPGKEPTAVRHPTFLSCAPQRCGSPASRTPGDRAATCALQFGSGAGKGDRPSRREAGSYTKGFLTSPSGKRSSSGFSEDVSRAQSKSSGNRGQRLCVEPEHGGGGLPEHGPGLVLRNARRSQRGPEVVRGTAMNGPFVVGIVLTEHHLVDADGMTALYLRPGEDGRAEVALPGEVLDSD